MISFLDIDLHVQGVHLGGVLVGADPVLSSDLVRSPAHPPGEHRQEHPQPVHQLAGSRGLLLHSGISGYR